MKSTVSLRKKMLLGAALLVVAGVLGLATAPADQPLSKDDITLLLLGNTPAAKIISSVGQRGVDFQMNADLAKKFHDQGATDDLIDALQKAGNKAAAAKESPAPAAPAPSSPPAQSAAPAAPEPTLGGKPNAPDTPQPAAQSPSEPVLHTRQAAGSTPAPAEQPAPASTPAPSSSEPVLHTREAGASAPSPAASAPEPQPASPRTASSSEPALHTPAGTNRGTNKDGETTAVSNAPGLKDPDAAGIQHIIQEFAAKEKIFRAARNNYTYHQINKVEELGSNDEVVGSYAQEWDILYDDSGKRIEKVTYAPLNTLKNLIVTKEDLEGFRSIQPFVLTTDEVGEYDINYMGHVKVDEITAFVFRIRPKTIEKNKQYFQGVVWVDDRDLQIVKSEGKQVPQAKSHGGENLFPRFTTWREQVDGKFWFPTYTMANDTLYFSNGPPVHMKEVVRYTDYKQFKSGARILTVESIDKQKEQNPPATPAPQK